ncbi:MAG TPA: MBL fold metallo-hydrolase [Burkholderiales bacterium]|nr:MBL fold metallo-hydrolase [Steroidobacteraceae bacterium]HYA47146.1 MBL fold metallo-hydrolase [Burkholderiales bacterium]
MRPAFDAQLVNETFGDPGVYLDLKFQRRALLFDIGRIDILPTRKLLRVSDVFVSHTHMDHFSGLDHLLRVCLGRDTGVKLYGPAGFIAQVHHKLAAYTWNLVENYQTDFVITAHELDGRENMRRARFRSRGRFEPEPLPDAPAPQGVLLEAPLFRVRFRPLDHHDICSLAFSFEESVHINVWKNRLEELELPTGPWITELKRQVRAGARDDTPIRVHWRTRDGPRDRTIALGKLKRSVLEFLPGQKVCYVTDAADNARNRDAIAEFAQQADLLFIETVFLEQDRGHAERKAHLTARAAGEIARAAGVRCAVPFHFSPRYLGREDELRREFMGAWRGAQALGE